MVYGIFTMLQPWGTDVVYREAQGYSVVVDTALFLTYSLPGAIGLVLTTFGLLGITARIRTRREYAATLTRGLAYLALALGLTSLVGVALVFDPVFTAARIFGTLSLGLALLCASVVARRGGAAAGSLRGLLLLLGVLGVFLLPVWPLVYALAWLPEVAGAFPIALFGIGWIWVGVRRRHQVLAADQGELDR